MAGSNSESCFVLSAAMSRRPFRASAEKCSSTGPSDERREEGQCADDEDHRNEQGREGRARWLGTCPAPADHASSSTIDPPIASAGMIMRKRPTSMSRPAVTFQNLVLPLRPAKAEPLFPRRSNRRTGSPRGREARRC